MPDSIATEDLHRIVSGVEIKSLVEAQCFHDGFVAGLKQYAEFLGLDTSPRKNMDLSQMIDDQSWRTMRTMGEICPNA